MNIKNKKIKMIIKVTTIAVISSCIYIGGNNKEVYALKNESVSTQSYIRNSIEKGKVNPTDYLNVRSGASVKNSVVTRIYTNDLVDVLEKHSNGWYKIKVSNGNVGWVNGKYIELQTNNADKVNENNQEVNKAKQIIDVAYKQLGKPYKWGASGPSAFDCSGFTSYVYKNGANINLPRTSRSQVNVGKTVSKNNLKAGDLVFFSSTGKGITHVGLYVGNSQMIHSPKPGDTVRIDSINSSYYSRTFVTAKSIL